MPIMASILWLFSFEIPFEPSGIKTLQIESNMSVGIVNLNSPFEYACTSLRPRSPFLFEYLAKAFSNTLSFSFACAFLIRFAFSILHELRDSWTCFFTTTNLCVRSCKSFASVCGSSPSICGTALMAVPSFWIKSAQTCAWVLASLAASSTAETHALISSTLISLSPFNGSSSSTTPFIFSSAFTISCSSWPNNINDFAFASFRFCNSASNCSMRCLVCTIACSDSVIIRSFCEPHPSNSLANTSSNSVLHASKVEAVAALNFVSTRRIAKTCVCSIFCFSSSSCLFFIASSCFFFISSICFCCSAWRCLFISSSFLRFSSNFLA
mmetsp:Transcript_53784/g.85597  ORF Transcript_53784/g.85597 Transcript_53784/m.85597 type:complete len:325 (-) Transcript_53784:838-1812(-)